MKVPAKRKALALLVALSVLLTLPASASAHWGWAYRWEGQLNSGYSYWVDVCPQGTLIDGTAGKARLTDAMNEWNEIGGELHFNLWDGNCSTLMGGAGNAVWVYSAALGSNTLGSTSCNLILSQVDQCTMVIDSDNVTSSCGSYTWYTGTGSPGANQIDLESVLVHELGHALSVGHSSDGEAYIMDDNLSDSGGCPEGIEKDERVYSHDTQAYTQFYGTTH